LGKLGLGKPAFKNKVWKSLVKNKIWESLVLNKVWKSLVLNKVWKSLVLNKVWKSLVLKKVWESHVPTHQQMGVARVQLQDATCWQWHNTLHQKGAAQGLAMGPAGCKPSARY